MTNRNKDAIHPAVMEYMKPDTRPLQFDIAKIQPMFYHFGGTAHCSCYMTIENKPHGTCPYWKQTATNCSDHQCIYGGGTMAGNFCVPYYTYLHRVGKIDEALRKLETEFASKRPEWHGCTLVAVDRGKERRPTKE